MCNPKIQHVWGIPIFFMIPRLLHNHRISILIPHFTLPSTKCCKYSIWYHTSVFSCFRKLEALFPTSSIAEWCRKPFFCAKRAGILSPGLQQLLLLAVNLNIKFSKSYNVLVENNQYWIYFLDHHKPKNISKWSMRSFCLCFEFKNH